MATADKLTAQEIADQEQIETAQLEYEEARLNVLKSLDLLDTPESEGFDRITRMASRLFHAPVSAVSLTDHDRQWFKSHVGTPGRQLPRLGAPCAEVTRSAAELIIPDLLEDPRFSDCPLAKSGVRFYAGAPLTTRDGYVLGAMCVLDNTPRTVTPEESASLHDFAAMVMAQVELQHDFGRIDPLSGLPNRNQLNDDLKDLERQHPGTSRVAVLIDLADANQLNAVVNVLGTGYIDDLVKNSSRAIQNAMGRKAGIYHVGTTSFVVLVDESTDEPWRNVVSRLSTCFKSPLVCSGIPVTINAVFGISPFELPGSATQDVLRTAIAAAHDARELELEHAAYSPASDEANRRRFTLLTDMRTALKQTDELTLVYQPRVDVRTGVCASAEALLRWQNPRLGNVSPGEFIPLVEQTALAGPITQWVMTTALKQVAAWNRAGSDIRVSINISARNLEEGDFASNLAGLLKEYAVPCSSIELEFTESALIRNRSRVLSQLEQVRSMGLELAIDDFGTGYSSFSYLHKLPATTMKIDQSFIRTLTEGSVEESLVRSMITMAHDINYRVVAEGVETAEIYSFLASSGCDEVQGYFVSRPLTVDKFEEWLVKSRDEKTINMLRSLQNAGALSQH